MRALTDTQKGVAAPVVYDNKDLLLVADCLLHISFIHSQVDEDISVGDQDGPIADGFDEITKRTGQWEL